MWSYYGSKSRVIKHYPRPKHDVIIEPFAGTARYALRWFEREVFLYDKYDVIVRIWKYLQQASEKDILSLPEYNPKERFDKSLCDEEQWLIAFNCNRGTSSPANVAGGYYNILSVWKYRKQQIAKQLFKIKHWKIELADFTDIKNENATWFIDPPYQFGGEHYVYGNQQMDYSQLAEWCKSRIGQTIVCENSKGTWLPFSNLVNGLSQANKNRSEVIWSNEIVPFTNQQSALF